jgi:MoxR-like ATPase
LRRAREKGHFVMFYGPPGTGKTAVCEAAFADLLTIEATEDTTVADFLGEYVPAPARSDGLPYEWRYKKLVLAMTEGRAILIDDFTLADPRALSAIYPALDGRGQVSIDAHEGEVIKAEPGYFVVACHNPSAPGARLSPALASRFKLHCEMLTDYDLAETLGVKPKLVKLARNLDAKRRLGEVTWAPQMRELLNSVDLISDFGDEVVLRNIMSLAPEVDRDLVDEEMLAVFGRSFWPLAVGAEL